MTVLMLRLEGPMQSWGTYSRFTDRDSGREPSKSGVIGLLCSALGRDRDEDVSDLASLRMAVRVEREGRLLRDYHTVLDVPKASSGKGTVVSHRYYLSDACFLVFLEGDEALLSSLEETLRSPRWAIFLGRKSFPPSQPIVSPGNNLFNGSIEDVITTVAWHGRDSNNAPPKLRAIVERPPGTGGDTRTDVPVSFRRREFAMRYVSTTWVDNPSFQGGA
jgi:CRISPR system Cascade subunit CasD